MTHRNHNKLKLRPDVSHSHAAEVHVWNHLGQFVVAVGDLPPTSWSTDKHMWREVELYSTCRCLAVPPVKVSCVDAGLQRAGYWVSSSLNVGLKKISVQLSYSIHTHLPGRGHIHDWNYIQVIFLAALIQHPIQPLIRVQTLAPNDVTRTR